MEKKLKEKEDEINSVNESFFGDFEGATSTPKGESFDESFINTTEDKNTQDDVESQNLEKNTED